jgi:hypothetical protein
MNKGASIKAKLQSIANKQQIKFNYRIQNYCRKIKIEFELILNTISKQ